MAATLCILACRHGQDKFLKYKWTIRIEKKGDSSEFKLGTVVDARLAALNSNC